MKDYAWMVIKCKPDGLLWFSPTCATWIWLSLGTTLRGIELHGDCCSISVVTGNATAELIGDLLLPYAEWMGLRPGGEQPSSSKLYLWQKEKCTIVLGCPRRVSKSLVSGLYKPKNGIYPIYG